MLRYWIKDNFSVILLMPINTIAEKKNSCRLSCRNSWNQKWLIWKAKVPKLCLYSNKVLYYSLNFIISLGQRGRIMLRQKSCCIQNIVPYNLNIRSEREKCKKPEWKINQSELHGKQAAKLPHYRRKYKGINLSNMYMINFCVVQNISNHCKIYLGPNVVARYSRCLCMSVRAWQSLGR